MVEYAPYVKKEFPERRQAETWAKQKKEEIKQGGIGVSKIDIDFNNTTRQWIAKILVPV